MMPNTTFDYYKEIMPFGNNLAVQGEWDGAPSDVTVTPYTLHVAFVKKMTFFASQDFAISVAPMIIQHSSADGVNQYPYRSYDTEEALLAACEKLISITTFPTGTDTVHGTIIFDPPIKLFSSETNTMTVKGTGATIAGKITFELQGWQLLETEYNAST